MFARKTSPLAPRAVTRSPSGTGSARCRTDNCKCDKCNMWGMLSLQVVRNKSWFFVNNWDGCKTRDS